MTQTNHPSTPIDHISTRSSLFSKLSHEFRRELDRAILRPSPASYRGLFNHFRLADHGVSFTAFYYYARRLHRFVEGCRLAATLGPTSPALSAESLRRAIARQVMDAISNDKLTPVAILCLSETLRMYARIDNAGEHEPRAERRRPQAPSLKSIQISFALTPCST